MFSDRNLQLIFLNETDLDCPIISFLHNSHTIPKKYILLVNNRSSSIDDVGVTLKHV